MKESTKKILVELTERYPTLHSVKENVQTAYQNDKDPMFTFAQQVNVFGKENDVLVAFSTSGNSKNCVYAAI